MKYTHKISSFMKSLHLFSKRFLGKTPEKGFTLIELLLVIGILAILASIVIIAINPTKNIQTAQNTTAKKQARSLQNAIVQYVIEHGAAPNGIGGSPQVLCADNISAPVSSCEIVLKDSLANSVDSEYQFLSYIPRAANADALQLPPEDSGFRVSTDGTRYFVESLTNESAAICIEGATYPIATGGNIQRQPTLVNDKLYVTVLDPGSVAVIDTTTDEVVSTIPVGGSPVASPLAYGTKLYVASTGTNTVSVINTTTNTVISTIPVGQSPHFQLLLLNNKVYVINSWDNTVSIINTATDTVEETVTITDPVTGIMSANSKVYITAADSLYVYDGATNAFLTKINIGSLVDPGTLVGTILYVPQASNGTVTTVDTVTDTVIDTITVSPNPIHNPVLIGSNLYILDTMNDLSVLNTLTNTVTATVSLGASHQTIPTVVGTKLYVQNFDDLTISVVDTQTNTVVNTINLGFELGVDTVLVGSKLYVGYYEDGDVYVLDTTTDTLCE